MRLTAGDVARLAELARIALSETELTAFAAQLSEVLEQVDALEPEAEAADDGEAGASPPVGGASPAPAPLRADAPGADRLSSPAKTFAPEWAEGFFTVPRLGGLGPASPEAGP